MVDQMRTLAVVVLDWLAGRLDPTRRASGAPVAPYPRCPRCRGVLSVPLEDDMTCPHCHKQRLWALS